MGTLFAPLGEPRIGGRTQKLRNGCSRGTAFVQVPTLVMHRLGDTSEWVEQARYIGQRIGGAEVVELPGTEHAPFMGDWETVLKSAASFHRCDS
jgi:pimeloyl-ACP methyl ester carboxylesterase